MNEKEVTGEEIKEKDFQINPHFPYRVREAGQKIGYKATKTYSLISSGELPAIKFDDGLRIMGQTIIDYLASRPAYQPNIQDMEV